MANKVVAHPARNHTDAGGSEPAETSSRTSLTPSATAARTSEERDRRVAAGLEPGIGASFATVGSACREAAGAPLVLVQRSAPQSGHRIAPTRSIEPHDGQANRP